MKNTLFTADHHFFHQNVIKHCNRPFQTAEEMNEHLIAGWNAKVAPDDVVIHVGDMYWGSDVAAKKVLRKRLNGYIKLIPGNHDRPQQMLADGLIDEILPLIHNENVVAKDGQKHVFVLCHYPMQEWDRYFRGSFHLHGHCHGNMPTPDFMRRMDVGVDCHGFAPVTVDEVLLALGSRQLP